MSGFAPALLMFIVFLCGPIFTWSVIRSCDNFVDPQITAMKIGALFLFLAWFATALVRRALPWRKNVFHVFLFLWVAWNALGISWAASTPLTTEAFFWTLCGVAIFLFSELFLSDDDAAVRGLLFIVLIAALQSILGILQWSGIDLLPAHSRYFYADERYMRVYGTFGNPNLLASLLCASIPAGVWLTLRKRLTGIGVACGIATGLMLVCIVLSGARMAQLGALIGVLVLLFSMSNRFRRVIFSAAVLLIASLVCYNLFFSHPGTGKMNSSVTRSITWKTTFLMVEDHPVQGIGPGQFHYGYLNYQRKYFKLFGTSDAKFVNLEKPRNAHNDYLETLAEIGIVGLMLFLSLILLTLRGAINTKAGAVACASLIAMMCDMSTGFPMHVPATAMLFWMFAGIANGSKTSESIPSDVFFPESLTRPVSIACMAFTVLIVATLLGTMSLNSLVGRISLRKARVALVEQRYDDALFLVDNALQYEPSSGEAHFVLGAIHMMENQYKEALSEFREASKTTDDPLLHLNKSISLSRLGKYPAALREIDIMEEMLPAAPMPKRIKAGIFMLNGRPSQALSTMEEAYALDPKNPVVKLSVDRLREYLKTHKGVSR